MNPPFGINWLKYHQDQNDLPHIERMGYSSFTLFQWHWNNRDACNDLIAVARKDALFLARDQPKSEEKDEQFEHDPAGKGRAHADDWAQKVKDGKVFTPLDRTYFLGLNEPNSNKFQVQIDAYNEAYCRRLAEHGLRAAAYSFGVGHPSTINLDPKTAPDWHWYEASAAAILEGDHIVATHEYGSHDNYGWGYWCGRIAHCPYPFTVVFDECGIDNGVTGGPLYGYQMYIKPLAAYCNWLDGFQVGQAQRASSYKVKVHSYNIFCYDFGTSDDKDWASYDIRPIRPDLEAFNWTVVATPPTPTPIPPTTTTMYVSVPSGARIRSAPVIRTDNILTAVPYGEPVIVTNYTADHSWADVGYKVNPTESIRGWMSSALLSSVKPPVIPTTPPVPPIPPAGDKWTRTINWVLQWEGGYQNSVADKGNWTGCAQGKGVNKGTNFGISACSYPNLDIKNLTKQQAIDIYARDYWVPSGASELPWPYCLLVMDTAVLHGVGAAKGWLATAGPDPYTFAAKRLQTYTVLSNWDLFGKGWVNRVSDLLEEMST